MEEQVLVASIQRDCKLDRERLGLRTGQNTSSSVRIE